MIDESDPHAMRAEQANRLVTARLFAGYKRAADAVRRFGWTYNTYILHERGKRGLRWAAARRYAEAYGVSLRWLMLEQDAPTPGEGVDFISASERPAPVNVWSAPPAGAVLSSDMPETGITSNLARERDWYRRAAATGMDYLLVRLGQQNRVTPETIAELSEYAARRVIAERAAERYRQIQATRSQHQSATDKELAPRNSDRPAPLDRDDRK
jgi:hypothetical protein